MSAFATSSILIFGGTGTIGQYITKSILFAKPNFRQVSLFTSEHTVATKGMLLSEWKSSGMSVLTGDVTNTDDIAAALEKSKADTVISCLGRGAINVQTELIRVAEESGSVKWFFPSEYGTDIEHNAKSPNEKPHQHKLAVRKYIRDNVKNMQITYLVTGPYFDMWVDMLPGLEAAGGFNLDKSEAVLIEDGNGKVGFCTMWDVGKSLVASLRHPEVSFGKALKVQSFVVTPNEVLSEYEKQTGRKWEVKFTPLKELEEIEARLWKEGSPKATPTALRRIWAEGGTLYSQNDNHLIGLGPTEMESLETAVERAIAGTKG